MKSYCFACGVWYPVLLFTIIYCNTHSQLNMFIIKIINHNFNNSNNNNNNKNCSPCVLLFISVDKKNQLDATFCIIYFSSNSCSTCFGQPCAHHQELTTA